MHSNNRPVHADHSVEKYSSLAKSYYWFNANFCQNGRNAGLDWLICGRVVLKELNGWGSEKFWQIFGAGESIRKITKIIKTIEQRQ